MELEISFQGNDPKWLNVGMHDQYFYQHPLVSGDERHQLRMDPLYGFGGVSLTQNTTGLLSWDKRLPKCSWNKGYVFTD